MNDQIDMETVISRIKYPNFGEGYKYSSHYIECSDQPYLRLHNFGDRGVYLGNIFAITCLQFPEGKYMVIDIRDHLAKEDIDQMGYGPENRLKIVPHALYEKYENGSNLLINLAIDR